MLGDLLGDWVYWATGIVTIIGFLLLLVNGIVAIINKRRNKK